MILVVAIWCGGNDIIFNNIKHVSFMHPVLGGC
jgi:hypothetical protein